MLIANYQIKEKIYESGQSIVYRAVRQSGKQPAILKVLKQEFPSQATLARFQYEYALLKSVYPEDDLQVWGLESYQNTLVIAVEDFGGASLRWHLQQREHDIEAFLQLAIRITCIVKTLHQRRIIHKDINPANIIWNPQTQQLRLIDFGIATELSQEIAATVNPHQLEGTLAFMAPEQTGRMNRMIDNRADLYALGATFYEMLLNEPPFKAADALELVYCHLAIPVSSPSQVRDTIPEIVSQIVLKLLNKTAENRYQSAHGLLTDLRTCLQTYQTHAQWSSFKLGRSDYSDRLHISGKLYGREREITQLLNAFQRTAIGSTEVLLVAGYSGIGKTTLVNEIYRPVTQKKGYFISGKFDQYQRNIPYFALIQAFRSLIHQILIEDAEQLARWKAKLLEALDDNGKLITDILPGLALIIGPQPEPVALSNGQALRFHRVFERFICAFATQSSPLAVFLDDLQWADTPSLQLLERITMNPATQHILTIGAYRDNEVGAAHPLMLMKKHLDQQQKVHLLTLGPLQQTHIETLIADTLHTAPARCAPLSDLCHRKTHGNPFFLNQFLHTLHQQGYLTFHWGREQWCWEVSDIAQLTATDNVLVFMINQIKGFSTPTQQILNFAACIGSQFDLKLLSMVSGSTPQAVSEALLPVLRDGLVLPMDDHYKYVRYAGDLDVRYKFLHDRVQQACYSLFEKDDKEKTHYRIGRLLLEHSEQEKIDEDIFYIVEQLNHGIALIDLPAEKFALAKLNLFAGNKAIQSVAYASAYDFLHTSLSLLDDTCWQTQYACALATHEAAAQAAYLAGRYTAATGLVEHILTHANTTLDSIKAYEISIQIQISQNHLTQAISTALRVLTLLHVDFPQHPNRFDLWKLKIRTDWRLGHQSIDSLTQLPMMTDPIHLAAMRLLYQVFLPVYLTRPTLLPMIVLKMVGLSLQYGNAMQSVFAYAAYGMTLCGMFKDIETGYQFGQLATLLIEPLHAQEMKTRVLHLTNVMTRHWKESLEQILPDFLEAYRHGLNTGDQEWAARALCHHSLHSYYMGKNLPVLAKEMAEYSDVIADLKQDTAYYLHQIFRQTVENLTGSTRAPQQLIGQYYNEDEMLPFHQQAQNNTEMFFVFLNKIILSYLFESDSRLLFEYIDHAQCLIDNVPGQYAVPLFCFYQSLSLLAHYPNAVRARKRSDAIVRRNEKKLAHWAQQAPSNYLHKYHLVVAEKLRCKGRDLEAMEHYRLAIAACVQNHYPNEEALANELMAKYYSAQDNVEVAQTYFSRAYYLYGKWGAENKVAHMEAAYPHLSIVHAGPKPPLTLSGINTSANFSHKTIDLDSLMKACRIISEELDQHALIEKMLTVMMENAGARRIVMLLSEVKGYVVVGEKRVDRGQGDCGMDIPLTAYYDLPISIIQSVSREQHDIVLNSSDKSSVFTADVYCKNHPDISILCFPVKCQGRMPSILYLENDLISNAFTPERLEVLHLLSAQAAISLENAELTRHLVQTRDEAVAASRAKSAFMLAMSHELRTPLNHIIGYSELLQEDVEEIGNMAMLQDLKKIEYSGKHLLALLNKILQIAEAESGQVNVFPETFQLCVCMDNIDREIRPFIEKNNNQFEIVFNVNAPGEIRTDQSKLKTIMGCLLENAANFTQDGIVSLCIQSHTLASGDYGYRFCVEDTGIGIEASQLERIFEAFTQEDDSVTRTKGGLGVGLSLASIYTKVLGGVIHVQSDVGHGSMFCIELPVFYPE